MNKTNLSENEWEKRLDSEQFRILRKKGTEAPGTGNLLYNKAKGVYVCAGCGQELFSSKDKFDSRTGWPSFSKVLSSDKVKLESDNSLLMKRTEVLCSRCGGHLGHVFDDGPKPTGKRFCINSGALGFEKK